jgi:hypothetical protein
MTWTFGLVPQSAAPDHLVMCAASADNCAPSAVGRHLNLCQRHSPIRRGLQATQTIRAPKREKSLYETIFHTKINYHFDGRHNGHVEICSSTFDTSGKPLKPAAGELAAQNQPLRMHTTKAHLVARLFDL